ncbi:MAG: hypothetical protein ACOCRK_10805, partial [bacterium]
MLQNIQSFLNNNIFSLLPREVKYLYENLIDGKIEIKEEELNEYIREKMDLNKNRIKNLNVFLEDDHLIVNGELILQKYISPVDMKAPFLLTDWQFCPGNHYMTFELINKPELKVDGAFTRLLSNLVMLIITKIMNNQIVDITLYDKNYLSLRANNVTFFIDQHDGFKNVINKEYGFSDRKLKPF